MQTFLPLCRNCRKLLGFVGSSCPWLWTALAFTELYSRLRPTLGSLPALVLGVCTAAGQLQYLHAYTRLRQSIGVQYDLESSLLLRTRPPGTKEVKVVAVKSVLFPCDTARVAGASPPLRHCFDCSASADASAILGRSKALSNMFNMPSLPLCTVLEAVHALHGTAWVYEAAPLADVLTTFGMTAHFTHCTDGSKSSESSNGAASLRALTPAWVADLSGADFEMLGKHWSGDAPLSAGELWVCLPFFFFTLYCLYALLPGN